MEDTSEKYKKEFTKKLNDCFDSQNWDGAIKILKKEIKKYPDEYFLYTSLSKAFYNLKIKNKALEASLKAIELEPNDPLVIYDYACILTYLEKYEEAIIEFNKIIEKGIEGILNSGFGENIKWTKSIINDSRLRIAICYINIGNNIKSIELITEHLNNRQRGLYSDFSKKQINKILSKSISLSV